MKEEVEGGKRAINQSVGKESGASMIFIIAGRNLRKWFFLAKLEEVKLIKIEKQNILFDFVSTK